MGAKALSARGRLGDTSRRHGLDSQHVQDARRDLAAAKIEDYIEKVVSEAPPLTGAQRDRLAVLLRDGGGPDAAS